MQEDASLIAISTVEYLGQLCEYSRKNASDGATIIRRDSIQVSAPETLLDSERAKKRGCFARHFRPEGRASISEL